VRKLLFFGILCAASLVADTQRSVVLIRSVDPGRHRVMIQPMYQLVLEGEVLKGSFVESDQLRCEIKSRETGQTAVVPTNGGATATVKVVVKVLVCSNGAEARILGVDFPKE
jgi:hypothetical protein